MNKRLLNDIAMKDFENFKNLPLAVYLTRKDGIVLDFNNEAKKLLELNDSDKGVVNIIQYYQFPEERDIVLNKLEKKNDGEWESNETLIFKVNDQIINLRFFAKPYKSEDGQLMGSLCLVFKITGLERFREFEDNIPLGLFEISKENIISYKNSKFDEILGISDNNEPATIFDFFLSKEHKKEYKSIIKDLRDNKVIKDKIIDLIRKDKKSIVGKFNVIIDEIDDKGYITKTKGVLEDVTYSDILEDGPIGLFSLKETENELIVGHCNQYFANIFGSGKIESCFGESFRLLFKEHEQYPHFEKQIRSLTIDDNLLSDYYIELTNDESDKELVFHIKRIPDRNEFIRFNGVVYDVLNDVERKLSEWKKNFAAFLHTYSSMCNSIKDTLQGIINAHGTDVVNSGRVNIELAFTNINSHINLFIRVYQKFELIAIDRFNYDEKQASINKLLNDLNKVKKEGISKASIATIRSIFVRIKKRLDDQALLSIMPNETIKELDNEISEILRYCRLLSIYYIEDETFEMTTNIEEIKQAVLFNNQRNTYEKFDFVVVLKNAITNLQEYANRRNIEIRIYNSMFSYSIWGDQKELYFAFYNLLHNAIKYSWIKSGDRLSTVLINIKELPVNDEYDLSISFENRGVGILQSEIDNGALYRFNYRGKVSTDRKRKGTGIGLWHTKKIIDQFKGNIEIGSRPVDPHSISDTTQPYITIVTLKFHKKYV